MPRACSLGGNMIWSARSLQITCRASRQSIDANNTKKQPKQHKYTHQDNHLYKSRSSFITMSVHRKFTMKEYKGTMGPADFKRALKMTIEEFDFLCRILYDKIDEIVDQKEFEHCTEQEVGSIIHAGPLVPEQQENEIVKMYPPEDSYLYFYRRDGTPRGDDDSFSDYNDVYYMSDEEEDYFVSDNEDQKDAYKHVGNDEKIGLTLRYYAGGSTFDMRMLYQIRSIATFFRIIDIVSEAIALSKGQIELYLPEAYKKLLRNMKMMEEGEREQFFYTEWKKQKNKSSA